MRRKKFRETLSQPLALWFRCQQARIRPPRMILRRPARNARCFMFKLSGTRALMCAVLPLSLLAAGCSAIEGMGAEGFHEVEAGNWQAARADFEQDYKYAPGHPVAQFNMAATHHHFGDVNTADKLFSEAVISGKTYYPSATMEPEGTGATVGRHACTRLHRDNKLDTNCGDQIAMQLPPAPPPAPVAQAVPEPAPAIA